MAGIECIQALLRAGADQNIQDLGGKSARDAAVEAGRNECASTFDLEIMTAVKEVRRKVIRLPNLGSASRDFYCLLCARDICST